MQFKINNLNVFYMMEDINSHERDERDEKKEKKEKNESPENSHFIKYMNEMDPKKGDDRSKVVTDKLGEGFRYPKDTSKDNPQHAVKLGEDHAGVTYEGNNPMNEIDKKPTEKGKNANNGLSSPFVDEATYFKNQPLFQAKLKEYNGSAQHELNKSKETPPNTEKTPHKFNTFIKSLERK